MKKCNNCGAECSDTNKFCSKCGAPLNLQPAEAETNKPQYSVYEQPEKSFAVRSLPIGYPIIGMISVAVSVIFIILSILGYNTGIYVGLILYPLAFICPGVFMFGTFRHLFNKQGASWTTLVSMILSASGMVDLIVWAASGPGMMYQNLGSFVILVFFLFAAIICYGVMKIIYMANMASKSGDKPLKTMHIILLVIEGIIAVVIIILYAALINDIVASGYYNTDFTDGVLVTLGIVGILGVAALGLQLASYIYMLRHKNELKVRG